MNPVIAAIEAGHQFHQGPMIAEKSPCKLCGQHWPCPAIREAREAVRRHYGALRPVAATVTKSATS